MCGVSVGYSGASLPELRTPSDGPYEEDVPNVKNVHVLDDVVAAAKRREGRRGGKRLGYRKMRLGTARGDPPTPARTAPTRRRRRRTCP